DTYQPVANYFYILMLNECCNIMLAYRHFLTDTNIYGFIYMPLVPKAISMHQTSTCPSTTPPTGALTYLHITENRADVGIS
ncbi:MAG: hypothetical protein O8C62_00375, partial [Candidatus Methanoperedens sp.]|nr:hypothetical protein [Candidatus Methanoperedens sp.]